MNGGLPMLVDGHMHLENGPLTKEYVMEFINEAYKQGFDRIQILDHTHRFKEFEVIYQGVKEASDQQREWLANKKMKFKDTLSSYVRLINEVKEEELPIEVLFGLEVCYVPEYKEEIRRILESYQFDFYSNCNIYIPLGRPQQVPHFGNDQGEFSPSMFILF